MRARFRCLVAIVLVLGLTPRLARAVEFGTLTVRSSGDSLDLPAALMKPDGPGPFPAIVVVHDCSGLGPRSSGSPRRWADFLVAQGYVIAMPDSFTPRGYPAGICVSGGPTPDVNFDARAEDAFATLAALRRLPYVDGTHVGIMGGSHGGSTTLAAMVAPTRTDDPLAAAKVGGFAAGIALYPNCGSTFGAWSILREGGRTGPMSYHFGTYRTMAPLLILSGALDDWTPASQCQAMVEQADKEGQKIEIVVYPGAHHAFDSAFPVRFLPGRRNLNSATGRGATTGGNPAAWEDAKARVSRFFAEALKKKD